MDSQESSTRVGQIHLTMRALASSQSSPRYRRRCHSNRRESEYVVSSLESARSHRLGSNEFFHSAGSSPFYCKAYSPRPRILCHEAISMRLVAWRLLENIRHETFRAIAVRSIVQELCAHQAFFETRFGKEDQPQRKPQSKLEPPVFRDDECRRREQ